MLHLAWKNVLFRKFRTILIVLGIASSIMLALLMSVMLTGTEKQFTGSLGNIGGRVRFQPKSSVISGGSVDAIPQGLVLSREMADQIKQTAVGYDPAASSAVVTQVLMTDPTPNQPHRLVLNGVEPGHEEAVLGGAAMADGNGSLAAERDAILGAGALRELSKTAGRTLAVGEPINLPGVPGEYTIRGIAKERDAFTDALVVIPLATAQSALKKGDQVSYVVLTFPVDQAEAAAQELEGKVPDVDVVTAGALLESINKALTGQRTFMTMIKVVVYFTTVAIVFMVMWTAVMERTREIGTLRALGAKRWTVVGGILVEAGILTLAGTLFAVVIGWLYVQSWTEFPNFVTLAEYLADSARTMGAALMVAVISSFLPALRAAKVDPLEALRYE